MTDDNLREEIARLQAELDRFRPQPMSLRCRDGHHNGTGDEACINCWCLCHAAEADREEELLAEIKMLRTWKNEDGKWFVFAEDLHKVMRGEQP